jgi:hypothetical protein
MWWIFGSCGATRNVLKMSNGKLKRNGALEGQWENNMFDILKLGCADQNRMELVRFGVTVNFVSDVQLIN